MARMATLAALVLALTSAPAYAAAPTAFVYATSWDAQGVRQYAADDAGMLTPLTPPNAPAGNTSTGAAASPDGRSLYVVDQGSDSVSQYDISADGTLTPKTSAAVATEASPFGIAIAPDGEHVYVVNHVADTVSVYNVETDGSLSSAGPATPAGAGALHVAITPDGASAYVTNPSDGTISQYDVQADGSLLPKTPATVDAAPSPAGIAVSPDGASVYATNRSNPGTISQYDVSSSDGTLAPKAAAKVPAGAQPVGVATAGASVYASNFGANTISQYDVDADGSLTPKATPDVPSGRNPWGLGSAPDGGSLYVAAYSDSAVRQYDIGPGGQLAPKATPAAPAGAHPIAVAAVQAPDARDAQAPTIDLRTPPEGAQYQLGENVAADYSCADEGGSGLASCAGDAPSGAALDTATAGQHSFTVTARDGEGNAASVTHTYTVAGYPFGGFLGSIQNGALIKPGATVPIVFSLGGDRGLDVLAAGSPASGAVPCGSSGPPASTEPAESPYALRYNATTGLYVFKWRTKRAWRGTCRAFVLTLSDGSVHQLTVKFRRCSSSLLAGCAAIGGRLPPDAAVRARLGA
jgi:6-phosphogluconolactonase (cycloisomerase 2 family)